MATTKRREEYVDPSYWHPKCKNFTLMDWSKWEAKNPSPPKIFDPPQRYSSYEGCRYSLLWWWNRSNLCQPPAFCWHSSCCARKPEMGRISQGDMFKDLLGPNPDSSKVPAPLRNALFWTENNNAPETLISFNRWAWRSQSQEGRVIGVGGVVGFDWTNDPTCFGAFFSRINNFASVQMSPDGKWILLANYTDPNDTEECKYIYIYVVQEGDVFQTRNGDSIDYVQPGDLVRCTWDQSDPYECNNSKLSYHYFPRRVATLDEETGQVTKNSPHYDDLLSRATNDPGKCCETCCYTCACCMSGEERWDFQVNNISDRQVYSIAPTPPSGEIIERL